MTLLEVAKHALQAMEDAMYRADTHEFYDAKESLRYAIEQAEQQEPVAWNWMQDGQPYSPAYYGPPPDDDVVRIGLANGRSVRLLYTAPTQQREHITDGSPCWCNPDVIEEEGGNVIVHNYDDNWQQYAKPGETAQQCIERHRAEQDALMKLYATPRKPLTDEEIDQLLPEIVVGGTFTVITYGRAVARALERAHGIGEQHE